MEAFDGRLLFGFDKHKSTVTFDGNPLYQIPIDREFIWMEDPDTMMVYNGTYDISVTIKDPKAINNMFSRPYKNCINYTYLGNKSYSQKLPDSSYEQLLLQLDTESICFCGDIVIDEFYNLIDLNNGDTLELGSLKNLLEYIKKLNQKFISGEYLIVNVSA